MAKTAKALGIPAEDGFDPQRLEEAGEAAKQLAVLHAEQEATVRAVAAQLGYQLPADCTDPDLIQRDIAANMRRSVEACLEVGRGLTVLKTACGHGNFIARLDVLGLDRFVAAKFMQAATKFSNVSSTAHLTKAIGNQTKLFEMLVLDDEKLEELELTGQIGELKLDDIATMSVKELRAKLREARESLEDKDRVLANRNDKINELDQKLVRATRQVQAMTPVDIGEAIRQEAMEFASRAEVEVLAMRTALSKMAEHRAQHGIAHDDYMAGLLGQVQLALNQLRSEFDIKATPDGDDTPEWLRPGALDAANAQMAADMAANGWKYDAAGNMVRIDEDQLDLLDSVGA